MSRKDAESVLEAFADDSVWQEWSDAALNKENWAIPKNGPDGLFSDTQLVQLPPSLRADKWIRAKDLPNLTEPLTVFLTTSMHPDLIANNEHLLHSEFARWFISALINLQYCGRDGLEISGENGNFIWNGRYQSWQGWMNVYSMNKAGKGVQHRPVVNPNGKYIVRLFLLGAWRRILVDDTIPVNEEDLPLLPRTSHDFELWPMLLSKALLKLASLTWTEDHEIVDFYPVTCLTGWTCLQLDVGYMYPQDKWDFIRKYAEHFEWQDETEVESQDASKSKKSKDVRISRETVQTKKSRDTNRTDTSRKSKLGASRLKALAKPQPVTLFLGLEDTGTSSTEDVPDLAPCWSHFIYVSQFRDIPLDPKDVKPPLARWKLFRWLKWAIGKGIIDPVEYFVPIRSLKVVSPLKQCKESIINKYSATNAKQSDTHNGGTDNIIKSNETDTKKKKSKDVEKSVAVEKTQEDLSFWADFNEMEPLIKTVHFFYKLDYFQYNAKLSDRFSINQRNEPKSDQKKDSRKSSPSKTTFKDPQFVDAYAWPQKMSQTRNEPLYIFTDSLEDKFFLINFSTLQISVENKNENETSNSQIILKATKDCLSIERHNWFRRPEKSNCLVSILTAGTKSNVLEIDRGRHLLRLYCHSESDTFVSISSDTAFHIGDRNRMYELMCKESETIDHMAKHISNSLSSACQAFGTERFSEALRIYYKSYLPPVQTVTSSSKEFYSQIHHYFIDEEVQLIKKVMPEKDVPALLRSLRIFFLNPTIGLEYSDTISAFLKNINDSNTNKLAEDAGYSQQQSASKLFDRDHAALIIQSFFKMIIIRKYKQIHNPSHSQHETVLNNLLKIAELFNYNKRESLANQMFRNILKQNDKLYDSYPCSKDLEHTLQTQELKGTLTNVKPNQWLPIVRLLVNSQVSESVFANIDLFVTLPRYSVRVFKNETCREILRLVNNVVPTRYGHTKLGYTIFCYGWSEDQSFKELPYSLNIITMKGQPVFQFFDNDIPLPAITMPPVLSIEELSNSYIPNSGNFISKWVVRVVKPCVASFRLRTSYENVRMKFSVTDKQNRVLAQVKGTSVVILPMVYLNCARKSEQSMLQGRDGVEGDNNDDNDGEESCGKEGDDVDGDRSNEDLVQHMIYYVEALILDDSWPLTRTEWSLVSEFKIKPTGSLIKMRLPISWSAGKLSKSESLKTKAESSKSRKSSRHSMDGGIPMESPYWVLQVVTDSGSGLEISQDRTKELEIARMKEKWVEENPDSLERGRELREAFLKKHEIQPKSSTCSVERKPSSNSMRTLSKKASQKSFASNVCRSDTSVATLEERTLKAPPSIRRLPPLDLSIYEEKENEVDEPYLRTESNEEMQRDIRNMNILQAEQGYANFLKDLEKLMDKQKDVYETFYGDYANAFSQRRADVEDAYESRTAYINSTKPVASSVKTVANKKSKTSKKT